MPIFSSYLESGFFRNISGHGIEKGVRLILNLVLAAMIARKLGPSNWGNFNFFLTSASFAIFLLPSGLDGFFAVGLRRTELRLGQVLKIKLLLLAPNLLIHLIRIFLNENNLDAKMTEILFSLHWIFLSLDLSDLYFQAHNQTPKTNRNRVVAALLGTGLKLGVLFYFQESALLLLATAQVFETLCMQALQLRTLRRCKSPSFFDGWTQTLPSDLWRRMGPLWIISFFVFLYSRSDQLILRSFATTAQAGIYSTAFRLYEYAATVPMILGSALFPILVASTRFSEKMANTVRASIGLVSLTALVLVLFSKQIILISFGEVYRDSVPCIRILFAMLPLVAIGVMRQAWLNSRQKFWEAALFEGGCLILVVCFQLLLVQYGQNLNLTPAAGACLALFLASLLSNALAHCLLPHFREFHRNVCSLRARTENR